MKNWPQNGQLAAVPHSRRQFERSRNPALLHRPGWLLMLWLSPLQTLSLAPQLLRHQQGPSRTRLAVEQKLPASHRLVMHWGV